MRNRLEEAGFDVEIRDYAEEVDAGFARRCGLVAGATPLRNDIYVCRPN